MMSAVRLFLISLVLLIGLFIAPSGASAAVGDIGFWRDSAGSQVPGTTFGALNFATQERNDGAYTFTGSNTLELDEAGNHLVIATLKFTDSSNGRVNYEGRFAYSGTGDFVTLYGSGYSRNNGNNTAWVRVVGLVWGNAANDTVQLEMQRDTDAPTGGTIADASHFQVVRLHDTAAVGLYTDTSDTGAYGTQTWTDAPYNNIVLENDTSVVEKQAGNTDIRLKQDATTFLVGYGLAFNTGGSRTQRVSKMVAGSTDIEHSFSYVYQRQSSDEYADPNGLFLYRNAGTSTDLSVQAQRGTADIAGSAVRRTSTSGMFVVELPSSAEVLISHDSTGNQDFSGSGTNGDFNIVENVDYNDAASFTKVNNTTVNAEQTMDALLLTQVYGLRTGTSGTRATTGGVCGLKLTVPIRPWGSTEIIYVETRARKIPITSRFIRQVCIALRVVRICRWNGLMQEMTGRQTTPWEMRSALVRSTWTRLKQLVGHQPLRSMIIVGMSIMTVKT